MSVTVDSLESDYVPNDEQLALLIENLEPIAPTHRAKLEYFVLMGVATAEELAGMSAAAIAAVRYLKTIQRERAKAAS